MELLLDRNDIIQTGPCARGTLAVLPQGSNKQQKMAVGELSGAIQCFSIKRGEVAMAFKTLPSRHRVTALGLGKGKNQRDRIFVAEEHSVRGLNKKGREFFSFQTNLTEDISHLGVQETEVWVFGEYVHNSFEDSKEKNFYIAPDRINDSELVLVGKSYAPVLACQDRLIRVLNGSEVSKEISVEGGAPTCVRYILESHDLLNRYPGAKEILYGTENGAIGQLFLDSDALCKGFTIENPKKLGVVSALYSGIDLTKDGVNDVVVGRDDGSLEVYSLDEAGQVQQVFKTQLPQSITGLEGGYITSPNSQDLVVHTFSGKVLAYSQPGAGLFTPVLPSKAKKADEELEVQRELDTKIKGLREEVKILTSQLKESKERQTAVSKQQDHLLTMVDITCRCRLDAEEACCILAIEASKPIFTVALQCDSPLELLDMDSNIAILSKTDPNPKFPDKLLATYRCQESTSRIEIKFKAREGMASQLQIMILPNVTPKICQTYTHQIKPLCLHRKLPNEPDNISNLPMCEVTLSGQFSNADIHSWLQSCIPDIPQRVVEDSDYFWYENVFTKSILTFQYQANGAKFCSDSVSALAILRESLTREATKHNQRVNLGFISNNKSMEHNLQLFWPKLEYLRSLENKMQVTEALQELKMQDDDMSYLSDELISMLDNASTIADEHRRQPQHLCNILELLQSLTMDWCRLNGLNANKQRLSELQRMARNPSSTFGDVLNLITGKC